MPKNLALAAKMFGVRTILVGDSLPPEIVSVKHPVGDGYAARCEKRLQGRPGRGELRTMLEGLKGEIEAIKLIENIRKRL